jgi:hypothetical protein
VNESRPDESANWPAVETLADVHWVASPHPAILDESLLASQCRISQLRRSGPGGQHRNKVSTAIQWLHEPTGITAEANESRDQSRNRRDALERLRVRMAIRLRSELASDAGPDRHDHGATDSLATQHRELGRSRRLKVSSGNESFPAVLALVLDDLHRAGGQPSLVGPLWNSSTTAVVALVSVWPAALQEVNRWREHHGRGPLRH